MVTYLTAKAFPMLVDLMGSLSDLGMIRFDEPITKLSPILRTLGLSSNWAVSASALCLLEVLVNRTLEKLNMSTDGKFEERFNRLSSKAKEKGLELPNLLAPAFWRVRHKVIHGGKEPTPDELNTILGFLNTFFQKSVKLKN